MKFGAIKIFSFMMAVSTTVAFAQNGATVSRTATSPTTFTVVSPASGATVSGTILIKGAAGSQWVNVAGYNQSSGMTKVASDVTPSNGAFALTLDTTQLSNGNNTISVIAFSVAPGQTGGTSATVNLSLNVKNGAAPTPTPTPKPAPTPAPTPVPSTTFTVSSPASGATESGKFNIVGIAGSQWVNVAAYDKSSSTKVGADVTPSKNSFTLTVDASQLSSGSHSIAVMAFSVSAGQSGGTSKEIDLTINVKGSVSPTPAPTPKPTPTPTPPPSTSLPPPISGQNYVMTFDDEFQSMDVTSSSSYNGAKWYNGTEQCCMSPSVSGQNSAMYPTSVDGLVVNPYSLISGGGLNITLSYQASNNTWYSGVMTSVDKSGTGFSQQYGYFEIVAQLSGDPGTWPAFWLLNTSGLSGTGGSGSGEIDVFEQYNTFHNSFCVTFHDWSGGTTPYYNCNFSVADVTNGYHKYALLWTASTMAVYFDDVQVMSTPTPSIMKQPYYMLVDQGLGGGWPTNQTPYSTTMKVKSIRVYAPK